MQRLADLIGDAPPVAALRDQIAALLRNAANIQCPPPVLLRGETGSGKGLVASALHSESRRAAGPFIEVNCAAIPDTLLEAELFGYERGAFTDARQAKAGLFQAAHGGTLFLDEVALLPLGLQAKLLKVLEDHVVRRLGSVRSEPVDAWVVAATSEDVENAMRAGRFRADLYHRLAVVTLTLSPLRERGDDIVLLAEHFLARACAEHGRPPKRLASDARAALIQHPWPGNVRELSNAMERLALLSDAQIVTADLLGITEESLRTAARGRAGAVLASSGARIVREQLLNTLRSTGWNVSRAAAALRVSRNAVRYWISKHGLRPDPTERTERQEQAGASSVEMVAGATHAPLRWERRQLVFLRASVRPNLDADAYAGTRALELVIEKVQSFAGRIEQLHPDGILSVFGLNAVEEAPRRAALAALAVEKAWNRDRHPADDPTRIQIALHASEALVGRAGEWAAINESEKKEASAELDALLQRGRTPAVVASEAAARLLEHRFNLVADPDRASPRTYWLQGQEPSGLGPAANLSTFVGRRSELAKLESLCNEVLAGSLRFANIVGAAGMGKSRLIHELRRRRASDRLAFVDGPCTLDGSSTPFSPIVEVVRSLFSIRQDETPNEVRGKLRRGIERLGLRTQDILAPLMTALRLESETPAHLQAELIGERLREGLIQLLRASSQLAPVALVLDDLHWADSASVELLMRLVEAGEPMPLLIICAYRPPYRPPWATSSGVCELELQPLSDESCLYLAQERLGASHRALAPQVVARAEGNPLFAEEIARYLQDGSGNLSDATESVVPDTLQHLLMPTVNRLPEAPRSLLETAAVIGTRFGSRLLQAALPSDQVENSLQALEQRDLIVREDSAGTLVDCRFKHALVREAVYASVPPPDKADLHLRIAQSLEGIFAGRVQEVAETLALHYRRAGNIDKTVHYLCVAGKESLRVHSLDVAERSFDEVIAQIGANRGNDAMLADAVVGKMWIDFYKGNVRAILELGEKYRSRFEALGDERQLSAFLSSLTWAFGGSARYAEARKVSEDCLALAEKCGNDLAIGYASLGLMWSDCFMRERNPRMPFEQLGQRAMEIADRFGDPLLTCQCLQAFAMNAYIVGRYADARKYADQLLELGRRERARHISSCGFHQHAFLSLFHGRPEEALEYAEKSIQLADGQMDNLIGRCAKGSALALMGRASEAIEMLRTARREIEEGGSLTMCRLTDVAYGAALVQSGRMSAGVRWIESSIRRCRDMNPVFPASAHLALGEMFTEMALRRRRAPASLILRNLGFVLRNAPFAARKARRHLEEAVGLARKIGNTSMAGHALLTLAELQSATRHELEARQLLSEARAGLEEPPSPVVLGKLTALTAKLDGASLVSAQQGTIPR